MDYPSVIMAWMVNITDFDKYQRNKSVGNSRGKYRRNVSIGDCGTARNFFSNLGKIPTAVFPR